jgi:hypothetical protein
MAHDPQQINQLRHRASTEDHELERMAEQYGTPVAELRQMRDDAVNQLAQINQQMLGETLGSQREEDPGEVSIMDFGKWKSGDVQKERIGRSLLHGGLAAGATALTGGAALPAALTGLAAGTLSNIMPQPQTAGEEISAAAMSALPIPGTRAAKMISPVSEALPSGASRMALTQGIMGAGEATAGQALAGAVDRPRGIDTPFFNPLGTAMGAGLGGALGGLGGSSALQREPRWRAIMQKAGLTPEQIDLRVGPFMQGKSPISREMRNLQRAHQRYEKFAAEIEDHLAAEKIAGGADVAQYKELLSKAQARQKYYKAQVSGAKGKTALAKARLGIHQQKVKGEFQPMLADANTTLAGLTARLDDYSSKLAVLREQRTQARRGQAGAGWTPDKVAAATSGTPQDVLTTELNALVDRMTPEQKFMFAARQSGDLGAQVGQAKKILRVSDVPEAPSGDIYKILDDPDKFFANLDPDVPVDQQIMELLQLSHGVRQEVGKIRNAKHELLAMQIRDEHAHKYISAQTEPFQGRQMYEQVLGPAEAVKERDAAINLARAQGREGRSRILGEAFESWRAGKGDVSIFETNPKTKGRTQAMLRVQKRMNSLSKKLGVGQGAVPDEFLRELTRGQNDPVGFFRETVMGPRCGRRVPERCCSAVAHR